MVFFTIQSGAAHIQVSCDQQAIACTWATLVIGTSVATEPSLEVVMPEYCQTGPSDRADLECLVVESADRLIPFATTWSERLAELDADLEHYGRIAGLTGGAQ